MNLALKGLVKLVDFKENDNFRYDMIISYLSVLVSNKVMGPFLEAFNKYERALQEVVNNSTSIEMFNKVKAIIMYRDQVMHELSKGEVIA